MADGTLESTVALIGTLNSPRFVRQVTQFVRKINRMKDLTYQSSQLEITFDELQFREELIGASFDTAEDFLNLKDQCDHGLAVLDLSTALNKNGFKVANDHTRDLFTVNKKGRITNVFQIETDVSATSINCATAHLLLNNIDLMERPRLILTVPESIDDALNVKLKKLGIDLLVYEWQHDQAVIPNLSALLGE